MRLRLGFSIAIHAQFELLFLDEVLAVGDAKFQNRCLNKIKLMKEKGVTIVLVSHDLSLIKKFCNKVMFIEKGTMKSYGDPKKVIMDYITHDITNQKSNKYTPLISTYSKYKELDKKISLKNSKKDFHKLQNEIQKTKSNLLDLIYNILDNSQDIVNSFWDSYNNKKISLEERKIYSNKIKIIYKALEIKNDIIENKNAEDFVLFNRTSHIKLLLEPDHRKREKIVKNILKEYKIVIRENKKEKNVIALCMKRFITKIKIEQLNSESIVLLIKEYIKSLSKYNLISDEEINYEIKVLSKSIIMNADELINFYALKYEETKNNKLKTKLIKLKEIKKSLSNNFVAFSRNTKNINTNQDVIITGLKFFDKEKKEKKIFSTNDQLNIKINYKTKKKIMRPVFGIGIFKDDTTHITGPNTKFHNFQIPYIQGEGSITYSIDKLPLLEGTYLVSAVIHPYDSFKAYDTHEKRYSFEVKNKSLKELGLFHINARWKLSN